MELTGVSWDRIMEREFQLGQVHGTGAWDREGQQAKGYKGR